MAVALARARSTASRARPWRFVTAMETGTERSEAAQKAELRTAGDRSAHRLHVWLISVSDEYKDEDFRVGY